MLNTVQLFVYPHMYDDLRWTKNISFWRFFSTTSHGSCIESPIFCLISSFSVKRDVCRSFAFRIFVSFLKCFPFKIERITYQLEGTELGWNELEDSQLHVEPAQFLANRNCNPTRLPDWLCHYIFTIDLVATKCTHVLVHQRAVMIPHWCTLREILTDKVTHLWNPKFCCGRSYGDLIDFKIMYQQRFVVEPAQNRQHPLW